MGERKTFWISKMSCGDFMCSRQNLILKLSFIKFKHIISSKVLLHSQLINSPNKSFSVNIKSDSLNFNVMFVVFLLHHLFTILRLFSLPYHQMFFLFLSWYVFSFNIWAVGKGFSFSIIQVLHFPKEVIDYHCVVGIHLRNEIFLWKNPSLSNVRATPKTVTHEALIIRLISGEIR